jgi:hypothetical protein
MDVDWNASPVVSNRDGVVGMDHDADLARVPGECFVDGIVYDFVGEVVESAGRSGTDVHPGTFSNGIQTFQNLNLASVVACLGGRGSLRHYVRVERIGRHRTRPEARPVQILFNLALKPAESKRNLTD